MSARRTWPAAMSSWAILTAAVVLLDAWMPVRAAVVGSFALVVPGGALVPLLGLRDRVAELTLAIALSLALDLVVACAMLYAGAWSPSAGVVVLVVVALAGAGLQVRGTAPGGSPAGREPSVAVAGRNGRATRLRLNRGTVEKLRGLRRWGRP